MLWQRIKSFFSRRRPQAMVPKALGAYRTPPALPAHSEPEAESPALPRGHIRPGAMVCYKQCDHCKSFLAANAIHWCSNPGWMHFG